MYYGASTWDASATQTGVSVVGDTSVSLSYQSGTLILDWVDGGISSYAGITPNGLAEYDSYPGDNHSDLLASGNSPSATSGGVDRSSLGAHDLLLPSYYIEKTTGPDILWGAAIAAFVNASGQVVGSPFAPGESDSNIAVPVGATELLLGVNSVFFESQTIGSWTYDVTLTAQAGVGGGVPEAPTYLMAVLGFLALAAAGARRSVARA
jgi:hypothetical protein